MSRMDDISQVSPKRIDHTIMCIELVLYPLTDKQRMQVFNAVAKKFCYFCGGKTPCQCEDEEFKHWS